MRILRGPPGPVEAAPLLDEAAAPLRPLGAAPALARINHLQGADTQRPADALQR